MSTHFRSARAYPRYRAPVGGNAYDNAVIADGAVRYYKLDETTGTTCTDSIGHQDGTWTGSPTLASAGATLNGSSQYATLPVASDLPGGDSPYTIEWMATPSSVSGGRDVCTFGANVSNQETATGFNGTNAWNYWNGSNVTTSGITLATGNEYHYAATYDQTKVVIYINAVQRASVARSAHNTSLVAASAYIGQALNGANKFAGTIRRVAIYTTALTATQVSNHYANR